MPNPDAKPNLPAVEYVTVFHRTVTLCTGTNTIDAFSELTLAVKIEEFELKHNVEQHNRSLCPKWKVSDITKTAEPTGVH